MDSSKALADSAAALRRARIKFEAAVAAGRLRSAVVNYAADLRRANAAADAANAKKENQP